MLPCPIWTIQTRNQIQAIQWTHNKQFPGIEMREVLLQSKVGHHYRGNYQPDKLVYLAHIQVQSQSEYLTPE